MINHPLILNNILLKVYYQGGFFIRFELYQQISFLVLFLLCSPEININSLV
jgi:hypothetical protein